jgi:hypothetical protein
LHTLFEFVFKGFDAMGYEEHSDYDLVQVKDQKILKLSMKDCNYSIIYSPPTLNSTMQWSGLTFTKKENIAKPSR